MIIPGVLGTAVTIGAIGVAAAYLAPHAHPAERPAPVLHARPPASQASPRSTAATAAAATTGRPASHASTSGPATAASGSRVDTGHALNDRGYALIQRGDYAAAIPLLRRAVIDLRGIGPTDPYEAYANYNLGYALVATGDCTGALQPLAVAKRLETNPLVDRAIHRASACAPPGS
jgi:TolA-binding protein